MRKIVLYLTAFLLCSCGSGQPITCSGSVSFNARNPAEANAVRDALARNKDRCGTGGRSCDVIASGNDNGEILVGVHFLVPSESSGTCAQRIGDETLHVYGKDGQYLKAIPGM